MNRASGSSVIGLVRGLVSVLVVTGGCAARYVSPRAPGASINHAMCTASSLAEATDLVQAVDASARPRIALTALDRDALEPVLGDRAGAALQQALFVRVRTEHQPVSDPITMWVGFWQHTDHGDSVVPDELNEHDEVRRAARFALTGERLPIARQRLTDRWIVLSLLTLGLGAATESDLVTKSELQPPRDFEYDRAGPRAKALEALLAGLPGIQLIGVGRPATTQVWLTADVSVSDWPSGWHACKLLMTYTLALPSMRPGSQDAVNQVFHDQLRAVSELPVVERRFSVENPNGHFIGAF